MPSDSIPLRMGAATVAGSRGMDGADRSTRVRDDIGEDVVGEVGEVKVDRCMATPWNELVDCDTGESHPLAAGTAFQLMVTKRWPRLLPTRPSVPVATSLRVMAR